MHLATRMRAEWACLGMLLGTSRETWIAVWWEELRRVYGSLARPGLESSTCAFKLFQKDEESSELQRRALEAIGELQAPKVELVSAEEGRDAEAGPTGRAGRTSGGDDADVAPRGGARRSPRIAQRGRRAPMFEDIAPMRGQHVWGLRDVREQRLFFNP